MAKLIGGTALCPWPPRGTALQRHIVTFQEPMARFENLFNQLQECPLLELEYPDGTTTDWMEQVNRRCPTGKSMHVFHQRSIARYVGRTDGLVRRLSGHRAMAAGQPGNSGTFARILAKEEHPHSQTDFEVYVHEMLETRPERSPTSPPQYTALCPQPTTSPSLHS